MSEAIVRIPPKLIPVFTGAATFRGAYGGRGSAKTRTFAKMTAIRALMWSQAGEDGVIVCGREFMNSLSESSMAEVKAAIRSEPELLEPYFDIGENYIRTADKRIEYAFTGLRHNLASIKSKALIKLLWVDEAENVSETAWQVAIPSVREDDSEIWITYNPEDDQSATHKRFRLDPPAGSKIVEMNWRDNPWFPDILNKVRLEDYDKRPDSYQHVWEGAFVTAVEGAYFVKQLEQARAQGRIGNVPPDALMHYRAFWDLGVADHTAIWIAQFVGRQIFVVDYCEAQGQPLSYYVSWLRERGYGPRQAIMVLPHDGARRDGFTAVKFEDHLRAADYQVQTIPNQGRGAAMQRIEAARRLFPAISFNEETTRPGLKALAAYHEKTDERRKIGLGPEHDWASHGADAFGLMCIAHRYPEVVSDDDDEDEDDWQHGRRRSTGY